MKRNEALNSTGETEREAIVNATIRRLIAEKERLGIKLQGALRRAEEAEDALESARPYIAFESKVALSITTRLPRFIALPIRRLIALGYALRRS